MVMRREIGRSYPVARITATPGRFCEAMVTTNRGSARLMAADQVNCGAVNTGMANSKRMADQDISPRSATNAIASASVMTTA